MISSAGFGSFLFIYTVLLNVMYFGVHDNKQSERDKIIIKLSLIQSQNLLPNTYETSPLTSSQ